MLETVDYDDKNFVRNLMFIAVFFLFAPIALGTSLFALLTISETPQKPQVLAASNIYSDPQPGVQIYASLPKKGDGVTAEAVASDARPAIIAQYLKEYNSPIVSYADTIVQAADKYGIDYRLVTAIAQQESNLCKIIPEGTYNCWGWGIHSEGTLGFTSYEQGIEIVTRGLKQEYIDKGYVTPEDIMAKYTPQSNGSWAHGVSTFMDEMQ